MSQNRLRILVPLAVAAILLAAGAQALSGWGKITIHADARPLSEVTASIARQSGRPIYTTLPPETKVTLHADRARLEDVLETLAVRVDGNWDAGFAIAPSKAAADALFAQWARREREGIQQFRSWGFPLVSMNESVFDPFRQQLSLTPAGPLHDILRKAAQETEAVFLAPENWNPSASGAPVSGKISAAVARLAKSAGGTAREAVLLSGGWGGGRGADRSSDRPPGGDGGQPRPWEGGGQRGGGPGWGLFDNPDALEGMVKRAEQRIAHLPKDEQPAARAELETARAAFAEIAALPPEQRVAKMMERAQDPAFQQRMEERMTARDFRATPQQRLERYSRYIERKAERSGQQPGK